MTCSSLRAELETKLAQLGSFKAKWNVIPELSPATEPKPPVGRGRQ
jgi:hypothetical protein